MLLALSPPPTLSGATYAPGCYEVPDMQTVLWSPRTAGAFIAARLRQRKPVRPMSSRRRTQTAETASHVPAGNVDPRHVFLTAREVIARYRWGRTKGYAQLRNQSFPRPLAGRYRLDLLMAWEDRQLADASIPSTSRPAGPPAKRHTERRTTA